MKVLGIKQNIIMLFQSIVLENKIRSYDEVYTNKKRHCTYLNSLGSM